MSKLPWGAGKIVKQFKSVDPHLIIEFEKYHRKVMRQHLANAAEEKKMILVLKAIRKGKEKKRVNREK